MVHLDLHDELRPLGWLPVHARAFAARGDDVVWPGRVSRIDRGGWLTVETAGEPHRVRQHPRFRRVADALEAPTVGDWVVVRPDPGGGPPLVEEVLPRHTVFVRNAGIDDRAAPQPLAANVDDVLIAIPLGWDYNPRLVDRFLSMAWAGGARPVIVLTKADLAEDVERVRALAREQAGDADVVAVSARRDDGLRELAPLLQPARTLVLIGPSGAGKSTLANRLTGEDLLVAGALRKGGTKGRHTTSHRQLLRLPGGALLIDTPGLRSVALWEAADALDDGAFSDVEEVSTRCRFSDCAHEQEPGCAVREAIAAGELSEERFASYRTLRAEAEQVTQARAEAERAQRGGRRRR